MHQRWGDTLQFVDVVVRQAHPGPAAPPYRTPQQKMRDAEALAREDQVPYPVLVDDLEGTTHQTYGGLPDPAYLIDVDGRISFYNMWTHAPTLNEAIAALLAAGGSGVVANGVHRVPHPLAAATNGWPALRRGWPQSVIELEAAVPGLASGTWLAFQIRPLLAPIALRDTRLPTAVKVGLTAFAVGMALLIGASRSASKRRAFV